MFVKYLITDTEFKLKKNNNNLLLSSRDAAVKCLVSCTLKPKPHFSLLSVITHTAVRNYFSFNLRSFVQS